MHLDSFFLTSIITPGIIVTTAIVSIYLSLFLPLPHVKLPRLVPLSAPLLRMLLLVRFTGSVNGTLGSGLGSLQFVPSFAFDKQFISVG